MTPEEEKLIRQNSFIIGEAALTVEYCRRQQYYYAMKHSGRAVKGLMDEMELLLGLLPGLNGEAPFASPESILGMLQMISQAQEEEDYVLMADLLEASLLPVFTTCQQRLVEQELIYVDEEILRKNVLAMEERIPGSVQMLFRYDVYGEYRKAEKLSQEGFQAVLQAVQRSLDRGYSVEFTSGGEYTIAVPDQGSGQQGRRVYLHTNNVIARESFLLASEWAAQNREAYLFYGLGFGYPYAQLFQLDENCRITVVESNLDVLMLAAVFAPIASLLQQERFRLEIDITHRRFSELARQLGPEEGCYIHYPSVKGIRNQKHRQSLEEFFVRESSVRTQQSRLDSNFRRNQKEKAGNVCQLRERFAGRDLYIIAGGPSLDKNMGQLHDLKDREDAVILSTGTVLKKLLSAGIRPDYVIITDAGAGVCRQVEGVTGCGVPLLFLSTVNSNMLARYEGEKYRIYQAGYPLAQEAAEKEQAECFDTGGSVTTTGMELGIRLGSRRLIFVGLDLAYTGGTNHAAGTQSVQNVEGMGALQVEAADGSLVETGRNLNIYREWIQGRLERMRAQGDTRPVIDATEGGAKKKGMEIMSLKAAIHSKA